ncbi:unnamed protein product [Brachionus calyciflorus]|uniref:Sushi domain-containing protein n=1 Tax=Brachionus calyciflorus TaxID=104777 RepID=A0A813YTY8_9BILA|nr:unnamed protein product [Brachionus calyciflorus]
MKNFILILYIIELASITSSQNFPPLSRHAIGFRYNRYGRSELDYQDTQDPIRSCGKRKRTVEINRKCFRQCQSDADCRGSKRKCLCDGECGLSCVRITTVCQKIVDFPNGVVNYYPDNFFGAQIVYDCDAGYILVGEKTRICEGDGWWSGTSPICVKETFCDPPKQILNAIPNIQIKNESKFKSGTEVDYECDIGYTFNSEKESTKIICMDTGRWSDVKFKCSRIYCGKPDDIENGVIKGSDFYYSSVIEYKCITGFRIRNGDNLRECGLDSTWSGKKPICEPVDCGEPPYVKNAIFNYNSTRYGSKVIYNCINSKFFMESNDHLNCLWTGRWSESTPNCIEKQCHLDYSEYNRKQYNLFTSNPSMNIPLSSNFTYTIDTSVKFICESGYLLSEEYSEIICQFNPRDQTVDWNLKPPKCRKENYCSFITPPDNGQISSNKKQLSQGYPVNTTVEFKCSLGFILKGTKTLTCIEKMHKVNGYVSYEANWSSDYEVSCEAIPNLLKEDSSCKIDKNGVDFVNKTNGDLIQSDESLFYSCKGNDLVKYSVKCVNGSLIYEINCNETENIKSCLAPPKLLNGYNKYSSTQHGSKVLYQCLNGYELSKGSTELKCNNGEWIGSIPQCSKMNCAFPGIVENGKIFYVGTLAEYTYQPYMNTLGQNKQIRYECNKDYKLVGPNGSTCINGNWKPSIKLVKCVRDDQISMTNFNETIKSDLDENMISFGLINDRKVKSLFSKNDENFFRANKRKIKKNLKLKKMVQRKKLMRNGSPSTYDLKNFPSNPIRRKNKKLKFSDDHAVTQI